MNIKHTGEYYTPISLSNSICNYILGTKRFFDSKSNLKILEPSFGGGAFINSIVRNSIVDDSCEIVGVEINSESFENYSINCESRIQVRLVNDDFHKFIIDDTDNKYNLIIGNPPYVRYRRLNQNSKNHVNETISEFDFDNSIGQGKNLWLSFLLRSLKILKKNGVIAFILPIELLDNKSLSSVRKLLIDTFHRIEIFTLDEACFNDAGAKSQNTLLFIGSKKQNLQKGIYFGDESMLYNKKYFSLKLPNKKFKTIKLDKAATVKWSLYKLDDIEIELIQKLIKKYSKISRYVDSCPGIVTAANKYFILSKSKVIQHGLEHMVVPILPRSGHLNGHTSLLKKDIEKIEKKDENCFLLKVNQSYDLNLDEKLNNYVNYGEDIGIHLRYKCKNRKKWYSIPNVENIPDLFFAKRFHEYPKLVINECGIRATDSLYNIKMKDEYNAHSFCMSFYNSLTFLYFKLFGKTMSEGVIEISPIEFKNAPLPYMNFTKNDYKKFESNFKNAKSIFDILAINDSIILSKVSKKNYEDLKEIIAKLI